MPDRTVIVTADDFGLTAATSEACVRAHHHGIVTAVSVLGNGAAVEATASLLRSAPDLAVGAHLALVGEDPARSAPAAVPTLVSPDGSLRPDWRAFLGDLARRRIALVDVRTELDAQLRWLTDVVGPVSHLNLHQHLQLWPPVGNIAVELAREHGIGFIRTPTSTVSGPRGAAIRELARRLRLRCAAAGIATTEAFAGLDEAGGVTAADLDGALAAPAASIEVNVHPGTAVDPDRRRFEWGYAWSSELELLCDPGTRSLVAASGRSLVAPGA